MVARAIKGVARVAATLLVSPMIATLPLRAALMGHDRAFQASCEWLSIVPGFVGQYTRRAFLTATAEGCGPDVVIGVGCKFATPSVRLDANAYVGPDCTLGWVHVERDVMIAAGAHIPSGPRTHGIERLDISMRDQPGTHVRVHVREGAWIGNGAIVLADVGRHAIVAAGAVVVEPVPDYGVVAGVPAKLLRSRLDGTAT
jgi:acetyltransferase-like isoleucine patch superfamily enzyme